MCHANFARIGRILQAFVGFPTAGKVRRTGNDGLPSASGPISRIDLQIGRGIRLAVQPGVSVRDETRVLGLVDETPTGVSYVRFFQPFRHLRDFGYSLRTPGKRLTLTRSPEGNAPDAAPSDAVPSDGAPSGGAGRATGPWTPDPALLDDVSLLMFPQLIAAPTGPDGNPVELVEPLCAQARRRGIPVVYSVDDWIDGIDAVNPAHETIRQAENNVQALLEGCDAAIVTTDRLKQTLAARPEMSEKRVHVIPNTIDPTDWTPRAAGQGLRVGWAGSSSHIEDLRLVLPSIRSLQTKHDFEFLLMGLIDIPIVEQIRRIRSGAASFGPAQRRRAAAFIELVRELEGIRFRHIPFMPALDFVRELPRLDLAIGLCPLQDTAFNRCKSALKFYEYAASGTLTIASDVEPYRSEVSVCASNSEQAWTETLDRLLSDSAARDAALNEQRAYVMGERTIKAVLPLWREALASYSLA